MLKRPYSNILPPKAHDQEPCPKLHQSNSWLWLCFGMPMAASPLDMQKHPFLGWPVCLLSAMAETQNRRRTLRSDLEAVLTFIAATLEPLPFPHASSKYFAVWRCEPSLYTMGGNELANCASHLSATP